MKARIYRDLKKKLLGRKLEIFQRFFYFLVWGHSFPPHPLNPLALELGNHFFRSHLSHFRYDDLASGQVRHVGRGVLDPAPRTTAT